MMRRERSLKEKKGIRAWALILILVASAVCLTTVSVMLQNSRRLSLEQVWTRGEERVVNTSAILKYRDYTTLSQVEWRQWLDGRDEPTRSTHVRAGTFQLENQETCGATMIMEFDKQYAVFKLFRFSDVYFHWAETHLREIKASYLDRILGTRVTPPCVGKRFSYQLIHDSLSEEEEGQEVLKESTFCVPEKDQLDTSVTFFVDGVKESDGRAIRAAAKRYRQDYPEPSSENAKNYAIFYYLAGCFKTAHNHFHDESGRYLSIDNDRCMTPESVMNESPEYQLANCFLLWKHSVFQTCHFPPGIVHVLEEAAAASDDGRHANNQRISDKLKAALLEDPLAEALLNEQPEAFLEIDKRAATLYQHIQSCRRSPL